MNVIEMALIVVFAALGVRSLVHWIRRPFETRDPLDHLFFAMFVTGRVGLWLALAGIFVVFALTDTQGRAFVDDVHEYDWYVMVFVILAAMQFVGGFFLGRRSTK